MTTAKYSSFGCNANALFQAWDVPQEHNVRQYSIPTATPEFHAAKLKTITRLQLLKKR